MRRTLAALVLLLLVGVVAYAWLQRSGSVRWPRPFASGEVREDARELGEQAREGAQEIGAQAREGARTFGAEARETLSEAGKELHDAKVSASVKTALGLNRGLRPYSIDVATENGVVTLAGRVNTEEERRSAESVAAAVPDVKQVVNRIQAGAGATSPSSGRSIGQRFDDEKIEVGVKLAFSLNRELEGTDITVQAYRGEVTLGGEVATEAQRQRALQIARDTSSVSRVVDHIRVRSASAGGGSAAERAAAAQRALRANPHLSGFQLHVVEDGERLVLKGAVRTPVEKDLAVAIAREAAGGSVVDAVEVRADA
jgi:osmotically-inducible protein OsmY